MTYYVYPSVSAFRMVNEDVAKWRALEQAISKANTKPREQARAVGSSLTYWTEKASPSALIASRMYETLIAAHDDPVVVELASVVDLVPIRAYDDTSDTELFEGEAEAVILAPGEVLSVGPSEAWRYGRNVEGTTAHRIRVTAAGPSPRPFGKASA